MVKDGFNQGASHGLSELMSRFDAALEGTVPDAGVPAGGLEDAMRYAVLGGGKRIRPHLLLTTAVAIVDTKLDEDTADLVVRAAVAVELIHSASLVHDDLPCFDDAELRRGKATVHCAYGVPMAVLVGDALITLAFETLCSYGGKLGPIAIRLAHLLALATGAHGGIIGGQSLELQPWGRDAGMDEVEEYHRLKTAALFDYAMRAAAVALGSPSAIQSDWGEAGIKLGLAFQLLDDLLDLHADEGSSGKTSGRDRVHGRPNGVAVEGTASVIKQVSTLISECCDVVYERALDPSPVIRLMKPFEAMLAKIERQVGLGGLRVATVGAG